MTQSNEVEALIKWVNSLDHRGCYDAINMLRKLQSELAERNSDHQENMKRIHSFERLDAQHDRELEQARDKALEEAAMLVDDGQEIINMTNSARFIEPRMYGNMLGTSYAVAIRALKSKDTTP